MARPRKRGIPLPTIKEEFEPRPINLDSLQGQTTELERTYRTIRKQFEKLKKIAPKAHINRFEYYKAMLDLECKLEQLRTTVSLLRSRDRLYGP